MIRDCTSGTHSEVGSSRLCRAKNRWSNGETGVAEWDYESEGRGAKESRQSRERWAVEADTGYGGYGGGEGRRVTWDAGNETG
jgi:hypothetical protein